MTSLGRGNAILAPRLRKNEDDSMHWAATRLFDAGKTCMSHAMPTPHATMAGRIVSPSPFAVVIGMPAATSSCVRLAS